MTTTHDTNGRTRLKQITKSRDYHKTRAAALADKVRELKDLHAIGYEDGAKATTLLTYMALEDFGAAGIQWISDRISAVANKKPAPHSTAIDDLVVKSVVDHMRTYNPERAAEVEAEFQSFLTGDAK
jgi:hypothetical protein